MASRTTSGHRAARAAASAAAAGTSSRRPIASTPCGVTVWLSDAKARSARTTTRWAVTSISTPSRRASTSSSVPQATASRTTRTPSRRTSPGSRRRPSLRSLRTSSLSVLVTTGWSEVVLRNLHQPGKGAAVAHRQVGEHFAVDLHTGLAEPEHEPVVRQTTLTGGGVDPRDPQPPEVPLALTPVAERVGERVQDRLVGGPEEQLPRVPEALGPLEDGLVPAMGGDATLDSSHAYTPSPRRTCFASASGTAWAARKAGFRLAELCFRRWLFQPCFLISFPFRVTRMRSLRPLRVLSLGNLRSLLALVSVGARRDGLRLRLVQRSEDHEEVAALHDGLALDLRDVLGRVGHPLEQPSTDVLMDHLTAAEHDRHLDLLTLLQERPHASEFGLEVVIRDLGPKLHLLELDDVLPPPLILLPLDRLELVTAVIQQPADRRAGLWCNLDQVDTLLARDPLGRLDAQDAQLVVLIVDQANLVGTDLFVDP